MSSCCSCEKTTGAEIQEDQEDRIGLCILMIFWKPIVWCWCWGWCCCFEEITLECIHSPGTTRKCILYHRSFYSYFFAYGCLWLMAVYDYVSYVVSCVTVSHFVTLTKGNLYYCRGSSHGTVSGEPNHPKSSRWLTGVAFWSWQCCQLLFHSQQPVDPSWTLAAGALEQ